MICLVTSALFSTTLDGVSSFSRVKKTHEIHVNAPVTVKILGGISFHVMVQNWKYLKDTLAFQSFLMC